MNKMDQKVQGAIVQIMAEAIGKQIKCHSSVLADIFTKVACASAGKSDCFDSTMVADQGDQTLFAKTETVVKSNCASIDVPGEAISVKDGHGKLELKSIPNGQLVDDHAAGSNRQLSSIDNNGRRLASTTCEEYSVI